MKLRKITLKHFGYIPFIILCLSFFNLNAQQLAFPSAKGAGAYTTGGRGGQVIHVTTLDWEGPGSLKEAIQTPGPRIIVFDVSGEIDATSQLPYSNIINGSAYDNITIAGQTAPAGGISIRTNEFRFANVSNIIMRYVRFRNDVGSQDTLWFWGGSDIIFDHCTFSHGGDESASWADSVGEIGNVTIQNCFFQDSKTGSILGVDDVDGDFTFINNVYSNISHRFPNPKGDGHYDIINNIVYNWKNRLVRVTGEGTYNIVNNYYKGAANGIHRPGWFTNYDLPATRLHRLQTQANDDPLIYSAGSVISVQREVPQDDDSDMWSVFAGSHLPVNSPVPAQYFTNTQFPLAGYNYPIQTAQQTYENLLSNVGADKTLNADGSIYPYRDTKDEADLIMIKNDSYIGNFYEDRSTIPYPIIPENSRSNDFDSNNDGMPDVWKTTKGFSPDENISNYVWPSGYIGIEEYLNEIDLNGIVIVDVTSVEVTPETTTINIPDTADLSVTVLPINASNQSGTWSSSDDAIATVDFNGLVTPVSEGEVVITFTSNDGGFTDEAIITITDIVILLESVSITPETVTLDLGENFQLNTEFLPVNTSDTTGTWSSSDDSVVSVNENGYLTAIDLGQAEISFIANDQGLTTSAQITVIDDFFGTYILYNADSDQEIQNIEGDVDVNLEDESNQINFRIIPEGGDANPDVESVSVSWTGPTSGTWIESAPIYAGLPSGHVDLNFEPYTVEEGTYNFIVTYHSENSGEGNVVAIDSFSLTFFFSSLPIANAGLDQEICEGETVTLTASGGANFSWNTGETTATIEINPTATTLYTVTVSDDEGNTDEDSVTVTVNELPIANVGDNQTICAGEFTVLTATGGTSYLWSNGETTDTIEVSPTEDTLYSVEVIDNNCSSTAEVTVYINDLPNLTINENVVIVEGESTILTASGSDNYEWSTSEITDSITVSPPETTTYSVSTLGTNGCLSSVSVTVTVIPE